LLLLGRCALNSATMHSKEKAPDGASTRSVHGHSVRHALPVPSSVCWPAGSSPDSLSGSTSPLSSLFCASAFSALLSLLALLALLSLLALLALLPAPSPSSRPACPASAAALGPSPHSVPVASPKHRSTAAAPTAPCPRSVLAGRSSPVRSSSTTSPSALSPLPPLPPLPPPPPALPPPEPPPTPATNTPPSPTPPPRLRISRARASVYAARM
jgi:hypothetical protein